MDLANQMKVIQKADQLFGAGDSNIALKEAYILAHTQVITADIVADFEHRQAERMKPVLERFNEVYGLPPADDLPAKNSHDIINNVLPISTQSSESNDRPHSR